jgi:phosphatidate phosphatase PAH1
MFYWKWNVPIVISDIDGTITKYAPNTIFPPLDLY